MSDSGEADSGGGESGWEYCEATDTATDDGSVFPHQPGGHSPPSQVSIPREREREKERERERGREREINYHTNVSCLH